MKYRTKLTLAFISLAILSTSLGLILVTLSTKRLLFNELRSKVLTIAITAATGLEANLFKNLAEPSAEISARYRKAKKELQVIQEANRRDDLFVQDIYTMEPDKRGSQEMLYGVDATDDPAEFSKPGSRVISDDLKEIIAHLDVPYVDEKVSKDPIGLWLSAFAPIKDAGGRYVATLGVDINASKIYTETRKLLIFGVFALGASIVVASFLAMTLSRFATKSLALLCSAVKKIGQGQLENKVHLDTQDEFNDLALAINQMASGLEERERLKANFAKYVSAHVLENIMQVESLQQLEGERRKVTVLFCDIRDFTRLSEKMAPENVVHFLNEYFDKMIDIIFKHYGTFDKFIGDGMMVEFGAPLKDVSQEAHAVYAAIEMLQALDHLNEKWRGEGKPVIRIGIGINTGFAVVGNIGSVKRMEYTAIGDAVNVAARLEKATKLLKQTILLSESTYQAVKDLFPCQSLGEVALPGRDELIKVYTIDLSNRP